MSIKNKLKNYFTMEDEYEYEYVDAGEFEAEQKLPRDKNKNVVNLTSVNNPTSKVRINEINR